MDKSNKTTRFTRGSEKKKNEELVLKNKGARTRSEEQNIRLEELRLRSEGIGLSGIFGADDDGSDTSMEMLKDEIIFHLKQKFKNNLLQNLGSKNLAGFACKTFDSLIEFCRKHVIVFFYHEER